MTCNDLIPEAQLAIAIAAATGVPCPVSYVGLANRRRSGTWPATQIGPRWFVRRADLPLVLAALGFDAPPATKARPRKAA